jgi:hypothetical protein
LEEEMVDSGTRKSSEKEKEKEKEKEWRPLRVCNGQGAKAQAEGGTEKKTATKPPPPKKPKKKPTLPADSPVLFEEIEPKDRVYEVCACVCVRETNRASNLFLWCLDFNLSFLFNVCEWVSL